MLVATGILGGLLAAKLAGGDCRAVSFGYAHGGSKVKG